MKKTFEILFMLLLIGNIGFGQGLKIRLNYSQLKALATELGTNTDKALALYAIKEGEITTLKYAVYNQKTNKVSYYDDHTVINADFQTIKTGLTLDNTVIFLGKNKTIVGSIGIIRKSNSYIVINGLNFINKKSVSIRNNAVYEIFLSTKATTKGLIKKRFVDNNGKVLSGGGGPGETVISKAP